MVSISCPAVTIKHFSLSREYRAARARAREREREKSALVTLGSPGGSALFRSIPWTFIRSLYSILLVRLSSSLRGFLRLRVRAHPHRDRAPRWRARSETRSRARQRSVCEQVQARCILCIPAGSRSHPASHVSPCSASVRACPSFFLLFLFAARPRHARVPHDAVFRSPSLSLSLSLLSEHVATGHFPRRPTISDRESIRQSLSLMLRMIASGIERLFEATAYARRGR